MVFLNMRNCSYEENKTTKKVTKRDDFSHGDKFKKKIRNIKQCFPVGLISNVCVAQKSNSMIWK